MAAPSGCQQASSAIALSLVPAVILIPEPVTPGISGVLFGVPCRRSHLRQLAAAGRRHHRQRFPGRAARLAPAVHIRPLSALR
jgi:hypothetical protein